MFVKGIMKPAHRCFTAGLDTPLNDVLHTLNQHDIQGMPVVDKGIFQGMISRQVIYKTFFESSMEKEVFLNEKKVGDIVSYQGYYVTEDDVFEQTLTTFKGFPIIAVVKENKQFLGIVSRYDVIEQFESAFGMNRSGVRIAFTSEESEGRIARLAEIVKQYHENVISLATFDETDKLARRIVLKIEKTPNIEKFVRKLERSGFRVLDVKED
ncbi:CBS domain-containing protein [Pontibacillus yanchengensis]|uniref:CBS domain-containing protein n=2 Tax=Pontibacillus yanchengensis TaxID=462910 RepID=A0ACC7VI17_9BACI|nr:CBS domain-containing protein [Pontibacillus yanchengensis]MYL32714.1 CBS domain-containing protein [Pontibacillus yanchengensis]MYL55108.1 CBS domain-containing protein [Pontibacillus yanchengensis]